MVEYHMPQATAWDDLLPLTRQTLIKVMHHE